MSNESVQGCFFLSGKVAPGIPGSLDPLTGVLRAVFFWKNSPCFFWWSFSATRRCVLKAMSCSPFKRPCWHTSRTLKKDICSSAPVADIAMLCIIRQAAALPKSHQIQRSQAGKLTGFFILVAEDAKYHSLPFHPAIPALTSWCTL